MTSEANQAAREGSTSTSNPEREYGAGLYLGRLARDIDLAPDPQEAWIAVAAKALTAEWERSAESVHFRRLAHNPSDVAAKLDSALSWLGPARTAPDEHAHRPPRLDIVIWACGACDFDAALDELGAAADALIHTAAVDDDRHDKLIPQGSAEWRRWYVRVGLARRWYRLDGEHIAIAHTLEVFNGVRVWLIATSLPYDTPTGPCLSNLLEVEGGTGMPGALALYISRLAIARSHFAANAYAAHDAIGAEADAEALAGSTLEDRQGAGSHRAYHIDQLANDVATMSESVANLAPTNANLDHSRRRLAATLIADFGVEPAALARWSAEEELGDRQREATMCANLGRHQVRLGSLVAERQHNDALRTQAATYLLAVVAGAATTGALADSVGWKIGLTAAALGLLILLTRTGAVRTLFDPRHLRGHIIGSALIAGGIAVLGAFQAFDVRTGPSTGAAIGIAAVIAVIAALAVIGVIAIAKIGQE